jgi:hypothetical protein
MASPATAEHVDRPPGARDQRPVDDHAGRLVVPDDKPTAVRLEAFQPAELRQVDVRAAAAGRAARASLLPASGFGALHLHSGARSSG